MSGLFISYRRSDTPDAVGRIYDRLVSEFGKARVFKDVDSIPLGQDFRGHLNDIVGGCAAVLAIIGPKWTDIRNDAGQKRLEDPDDFVRIELEAALARSVPVVPVLVGHAPMPGASQLPTTLSSLAFRQSIEVRPDPDFHNDATRLVAALRQILDPNAPRQETLNHAAGAKHSLVPWLVGVAAAMTLATIALAIPTWKHLRETPPAETRVDIVTPATDHPEAFALSPDGTQIVFVARTEGVSRLWLRSLGKATAQPLVGTEGADGNPFWSPDSRSIGFFTGSMLKRLDLAGGQPQALTTAFGTGGGSWSRKGVILFSTGAVGPLSRIAATGGEATALPLLPEGADTNVFPVFLPDGEHFLFGRFGRDAGIYLGSLKGTAVRLASSVLAFAYLPSGWLLRLGDAGALVAQRLDLAKAVLTGEPITLAQGVTNLSVSASGLVAYRSSGGVQYQLTWVDRSGAVRGTVGAPDDTLLSPRVSPDGRQIAFSRMARGKRDVWFQEDARATRVTLDNGNNDSPVWTPDGKRLAYVTWPDPGAGVYQKPINGAQAQEPLLLSSGILFPTSWSADGKYLMYFSQNPGRKFGLWVLPTSGDRKPFAYLDSKAISVWGQFSPDGRWVAYQSDESGAYEVYVRRFIAPGEVADASMRSGQWPVSTAGGVFPTWRADGKELYYIDPSDMMMAVPIKITGSLLEPGTPVALFQTHARGGGTDSAQGRQYDVASDGRFILNRVLDSSVLPITLIQNWNPAGGN